MSLELTLIPLAPVVINVLDKEYYNSWIRRKRIKKETEYSGIDAFLSDLNKIGYKYDVQQETVRISGKKEGSRYYFSNIDGKWVLSFSEYDSPGDIEYFIKSLSRVSCGYITDEMPVMRDSRKTTKIVSMPSSYNMPNLDSRTVCFYPTIFNDSEMLKSVLRELEIHFSINGDEIEFNKDGTKCTFIKNVNNQYILRTVGNVSEEDLFLTIQELDIVYLRDAQKRAYESVISKLPENNMTIESEVRLDDDTIILTLNVE